jgi:hypothetical protein
MAGFCTRGASGGPLVCSKSELLSLAFHFRRQISHHFHSGLVDFGIFDPLIDRASLALAVWGAVTRIDLPNRGACVCVGVRVGIGAFWLLGRAALRLVVALVPLVGAILTLNLL